MPQELAALSARLAAQLSREAPDLHIDLIARDAVRIARVAAEVRTTNRPAVCVARVRRIAARYGARTIHAADPHGMALGLRFSRGRFSSAAHDIMFLV